MKIILIGNKLDLDDTRVINKELAEVKTKEIGAINYYEISALYRINNQEPFDHITKVLVEDSKKF